MKIHNLYDGVYFISSDTRIISLGNISYYRWDSEKEITIGKLSLEEAREDIQKFLIEDQNKKNIDLYVKDLLSKAKVERFTPKEEKE